MGSCARYGLSEWRLKGVYAVLINKRLLVLHTSQCRFASFHSFYTISRRGKPHALALSKYISRYAIWFSGRVWKFLWKMKHLQVILATTYHHNPKILFLSFESSHQKWLSGCSSYSVSFLWNIFVVSLDMILMILKNDTRNRQINIEYYTSPQYTFFVFQFRVYASKMTLNMQFV